MNSPEPSTWYLKFEDPKYNEPYTERCQGVATDGKCWFFSSNHGSDDVNEKKCIYKVDFNFNVLYTLNLKHANARHLGAISYHQGILYVACEKVGIHDEVMVLTIDSESFNSFNMYPVKGIFGSVSLQKNKLPWCAVHPWNGLLYSSFFGDEDYLPHLPKDNGVNEIWGYDLRDGGYYHVPSATIYLKTPARGVQGGVFTKNGNLLLSDDKLQQVLCYSSLNGHFWGGIKVDKNHKGREWEEMEGLCVFNHPSPDGITTQIHLILLDMDPWEDDFYFKHFSVPKEYEGFL